MCRAKRKRKKVKFGAVGLIQKHIGIHTKFLGLQCAKGRGIILPGGKFDPAVDNNYQDTAARETEEETGIIVNKDSGKLLLHMPLPDGYYGFAYTFPEWEGEIDEFNREGIPGWYSREEFFLQDYSACNFSPFYHVLFHEYA